MQHPVFTDNEIDRVVRAFYARVRTDSVLGPIFAQKIEDTDGAWDAHMQHISDFWASIFIQSGRFNGNPMLKHTLLKGITPAHFQHWLNLFADTSQNCLSADKHKAMCEMAERIAKSLQMGLAFHHRKSGTPDNPFAEFGVRRSHTR